MSYRFFTILRWYINIIPVNSKYNIYIYSFRLVFYLTHTSLMHMFSHHPISRSTASTASSKVRVWVVGGGCRDFSGTLFIGKPMMDQQMRRYPFFIPYLYRKNHEYYHWLFHGNIYDNEIFNAGYLRFSMRKTWVMSIPDFAKPQTAVELGGAISVAKKNIGGTTTINQPGFSKIRVDIILDMILKWREVQDLCRRFGSLQDPYFLLNPPFM